MEIESKANLVLLVIQSSFKVSIKMGNIRITKLLATSIRIEAAIASSTSILSIDFNSQGRAVNVYGMEVNAPTGHKSIILPLNSPSIVVSI